MKSTIRTICNAYSSRHVANHCNVTIQAVNYWTAQGFVPVRRIDRLSQIDKKFTADMFRDDIINNKKQN